MLEFFFAGILRNLISQMSYGAAAPPFKSGLWVITRNKYFYHTVKVLISFAGNFAQAQKDESRESRAENYFAKVVSVS